jgi:hypothetical protein
VGKTSSLSVREEHRLRWNKVPIRILGHKREDAIGGWKILHNEEINNVYTLV